MRFHLLTIGAAALTLSGCGGEVPDQGNVGTAEGRAAGTAGGPGARTPATNPAPATPETASSGAQFVALAGGGDLFEIESARIAQQKAQRPDVREFAAMLLADHQRSTAQLTRAAAQARPPLAAAPVLNAEQQANRQALRAANGRAFDAVYLRQQVNAHEQAMNLVTSYAAGGDVEPLRRHAAAVAEPIQRHLARARQLEVPPPR